MSFSKFDICVQNKEKMSSFEHDIETIKGYLCEIGNTYLLIAYRVYEMDLYKSYEGKYKNLVEACQDCLGWKKSTTYNMLNIVKRFGTPNSNGFIPYDSLFGSSRFSYSQLCEMLSLSDKQLEKITPDTTVKEIREMKKQAFQTSGKQEVIDVVDFVIGEEGIEEAPEPAEVEQPVEVSDRYYEVRLSADELALINKLGNIKDVFYSEIGGKLRNSLRRSGYKWDIYNIPDESSVIV